MKQAERDSLPDRSPLELTEVYTLLVRGEALSTRNLAKRQDEEMQGNRKEWGHCNGPQWLARALAYIGGAKVEFAERREEVKFLAYVRRAREFLQKKGISPADAEAAVCRVAEEESREDALHKRFLSQLQTMAFDGKIVVRGKQEEHDPHGKIESDYFVRPIDYDPRGNAIWPRDLGDRRPHYHDMLIGLPDAQKLVEVFCAAALSGGGQASRGRASPAKGRADKALSAMYGGSVPDQAEVSNNSLNQKVNDWLKQCGLDPVSKDTVMRRAGRRSK